MFLMVLTKFYFAYAFYLRSVNGTDSIIYIVGKTLFILFHGMKSNNNMEYKFKKFEELDIIDDYMMNLVASDPVVGQDFSRTLAEALLQRKLGKIRVNVQRVIPGNPQKKRGIRMDVEVLEYDDMESVPINIYDLELNKRTDIDIIKHNRYYQAKIDADNLKSGEKDFIRLPNLFVIMVTNYDPFGYNQMLYTVHNKCDEVSELKYEDGLYFLYFNTTGTKGGNEALRKALAYIEESKEDNVTDDVTKHLHECVSVVKELPETRVAYMMLEEKIFYERRDAKEEGREEISHNLLSEYS